MGTLPSVAKKGKFGGNGTKTLNKILAYSTQQCMLKKKNPLNKWNESFKSKHGVPLRNLLM